METLNIAFRPPRGPSEIGAGVVEPKTYERVSDLQGVGPRGYVLVLRLNYSDQA